MKKFTKKLLACLIGLSLFAGCGGKDKDDKRKDLESIKLTLVEQDEYYTKEEIEVKIKTKPDYELTEDDFSLFGGRVVVDGDTATLIFTSAGTFHVYAAVDDIESNMLTITVRSNPNSKYADDDDDKDDKKKNESKPDKKTQNNTSETTKKDKNDLSDWENLRDADSSQMGDASANPGTYMAIEGTVSANGMYITANNGATYALSGIPVTYTGRMRMYGVYDGSTFKVSSYYSYTGQQVEDNEEYVVQGE